MGGPLAKDAPQLTPDSTPRIPKRKIGRSLHGRPSQSSPQGHNRPRFSSLSTLSKSNSSPRKGRRPKAPLRRIRRLEEGRCGRVLIDEPYLRHSIPTVNTEIEKTSIAIQYSFSDGQHRQSIAVHGNRDDFHAHRVLSLAWPKNWMSVSEEPENMLE